MEQDFTKGLSVCIGNYGYYNEGYLHDTWITLPKTEAEIRDFLHLNHLQDPLHEEIYISDYDGIPFGATQLFTEFCQLEDLNLLAKQLVTVSPSACHIGRKSAATRPNCSMMENRLKRLQPRSINRKRHMEPYRESPLHGLTCGGLSLFWKINL